MFKFTQAILRQTNQGFFPKHKFLPKYSTTATAELEDVSERKPKVAKSTHNMVAAAFASLSNETSKSKIETPVTNSRIENAKTVDELLSISNGEGVSRKFALRIVSMLADWSANETVKLSDFESDPRFIKLCRVLSKGSSYQKVNSNRIKEQSQSEDLSTIMNVAADDEAAKLVASFTLSQMVKVMQNLATKQRRSTLLLRSLSFNITKCPQKLNLKQSADLLYSMCILSFPDENILGKISTDILQDFNNSLKKSSVIGSILTSLGLLRYKDSSGVLETLCAWMTDNFETCRSQDVFSLVHTLGILNYDPNNEHSEKLFNVIAPQMVPQDANKPNIWLDFVWSLVMLNRATDTAISSVLNEDFLSQIEGVAAHVKILQVNGAARLLQKSYKGPLLKDDSKLFETTITRTKDKENMVKSVLDTLKNLMKSDTYIKNNVDTKMGFLIDAECILDKKCSPITPDKYSPSAGHTKVAIMVLDYHDMCRGKVEPTGITALQERLLEKQEYKVIKIPYHDYRARDKLIHRVQLIESKLKSAIIC